MGLAGPLAWPTAFEDVLGYTLWPKEYGDRLQAHGLGDVLSTVFTPGATLAERVRASLMQAKARDGQSTTASAGSAPGAAGVCASAANASDWPVSRIERSLDLTPPQREALDRFKSALNGTFASIRHTCRDDTSLPAAERLKAFQATLWAVHDGAVSLRAPLASFYDLLTDEQKKQFAAPPADPHAVDLSDAGRADIARKCGMSSSNDMPARQIEQTLRPNEAQKASLEALQKKSAEMGQFLIASCLKPLAPSPVERLDSAADRLTAVIFAASTINLAVNDFYGQLTDEQKARIRGFGQ